MTETGNPSREAEPVLYRTTIHWVAVLGPAMLFAIGLVSVGSRLVAALVMMGLAVIWGLFSIQNPCASEFAVRPSRLTIRVGFPLRQFYEFPYSRLAGAEYYQPALGGILNFGKIMLIQSSGEVTVFRLVAKPNELVERLKREIIRFRQENEPGAAESRT
jgi:membrane protein YdbS with pleckstrin-like domain